MLGIPATAAALSGGQAHAQGATAPPTNSRALQVSVKSRQVAFGHDVAVTGTAPASDAGQTFVLQFERRGRSNWQSLKTTKVRSDGSFALKAPVRHSGLVRVIGTSATAASAGTVPASTPKAITVSAQFRVRGAAINVLSGQSADVRGMLLPGVGGRKVRLEGLGHGRWRALASTRTSSRGAFHLHFVAGGTGRMQLRVRFGGDRLNGTAGAHTGSVTVYVQSVASWYNDGGSTACGFHAHYGVANKTMPCGSKVTFRYNGRTVTATVDDRGPYVGGRQWDLNQNTAAALGFGGVDTVWVSA